MTHLLNDVILKTGLIEHIGSDRPVELFSGLTITRVFFLIILPICIFIMLSFILKRRYEAKIAKDDIILNGFYDPIEDD
jgi:dolichyl-phosphate-mannose--protein O-mannosyl transferase